MILQENISLKDYNTFGINAIAKKFISVNSLLQLKEVIAENKDIFILSGGSNILLTKNISKPVIHINTKGIEVTKQTENNVFVKVQSGENWHDFVLWCIRQNYGGIENLSLIPGNVGTSPMQNIGAYGVEIKDVFYQLEALEIATGKIKIFDKNSCNFGYRESVFKNIEKGKFIIINVSFQLTKARHRLNTSYGSIQTELKKNKITDPTIQDISDAIINIRQSKLPDPKEIGNSGSFFKNPVIGLVQFTHLKKEFPEIPYYKISSDLIKIPAGWLVEQCNFKGKRFGDAGVHKNQALVLVNYGKATGKEIYELAENIQNTIHNKFGINLEIEVNII